MERAHYDKNLGVAEITKVAAESFVQRYHPDQYDQFLQESKSSDYPVYLDFEDILTALEGMEPYQVLMKVALTESVDNLIEKTNLASFVVLQSLRSHAIMNSMIDWHEALGYAKFEHFVTLKWMLSDATFLFPLVHPLVNAAWTLYTSPCHAFPLCDSPVLVSEASTMVALSPRLLLELRPRERTSEERSPLSKRISEEKLEEFRLRTIGSTFREIIGRPDILEEWRASPEFRARVELMKDVKKYNAMVYADGERELWQLNAYANAN